MKSDYLKYWRVIRQYTKVRYGLSQSDLDVLLFLNSEGYFSKSKFSEFAQLVSWDEQRFARLLRDGWIENFRERYNSRRALYSLSYKSRRMLDSIYKKLDGEEISEVPDNNPMFRKKVRFSDKVYRNMIKSMNKAIKEKNLTGQLQHPSLE